MKTNLCIASLFLFVYTGLLSQETNIQISGSPDEWANEPSVCINPLNTDQLIVGANSDNYYTSDDGGLTWQHGFITSSWGVNCDPVIVADTSGNFYYFHLVPDLSRVVCQKKNGFTSPWSNGSFTAEYSDYDIDKVWAIFDPVTNNLYTSWSRFNTWGSNNPQDSTDIFIAKSTDGGLTWGDQKLISNTGGNATGGFYSVHGSYPATGPEGEVYIAWWSPAGLMFDKSTDEGETWLSTDLNITGFPVQWIHYLPGIQTGVSFPMLACDRSNGPDNGTIYVNWADKRNGSNDSDIWLAKSTDGGTTWSEPIRVNDDGPDRHQFFNYMTIDQVTGKIYILFYDRRNYTDSNTDVYLAISVDGGESFSNHKISDGPFIPFSTVFFGHYISVSAHNDKVFATWMRMDEGQLSLWGAGIDPATVGIIEEKQVPLSMSQNIPNPFQEYTFFSFKLSTPEVVSIRVSDMSGKCVATLIHQENMASGKHVIHFSPEKHNLSPGVYSYSLVSNTMAITRKMIYAR